MIMTTARIRDALKELVTIKDLKMENAIYANDRETLAWQEARAALAAQNEPCIYEARTRINLKEFFGAARLEGWCRTHGWDCPNIKMLTTR